MSANESFTLSPVGHVESTLTDRRSAPRQGAEGAPDAWVAIAAALAEALDGLMPGDEIVLITWLHQSNRDTLKVRPRNNPRATLTGVFATRSPDRPNPLGLHRVTILAIEGLRLHVAPLEAIDGTPIVDIKPVIKSSIDA